MQLVPIGIVAGGWTVFGLLSYVHVLVYARVHDIPAPPAGPLFMLLLGSAWIWAALTPLALRLTVDDRPAPARWPRHLLVHALAGVAFVLISTLLEHALALVLGLGTPTPFLQGLVYHRMETRFLAYLVIVTLAQAARWHAMYRRRQRLTAELEDRLARSQLQLLKMQLQPHFLFNTLNTIAELVHADPNAADRMIGRLARLLRLSLDHAGYQVVPLRQEVEFLGAYAEIEQVRFQGRLMVHWEIAPDTLDAAVPTLLWQPALENAIRHGLGPLGGYGRVTVAARREGETLVLEIRDTGRGPPPAGSIREGVGLRNIRERMAQLYGERGSFTLTPAWGGGAIAVLRLPYTRCSAAHTPVPQSAPGLEEVTG